MAKASVYIVIFLISTNAGAAMLQSQGITDDLGVGVCVSQADELDRAQDQADEYGAGSGVGDTLFGLYASLAGVLETVFNAVMPAGAMLKCNGAPDFIINFGFTVLAMIPMFNVISFLRSGGDLL